MTLGTKLRTAQKNAAKEITERNVTNCVGPVPISPTALMWTEFVGPVVVPAIGTISAKKFVMKVDLVKTVL